MTVSDVVEERIAIVEDWVAENPESDFDLDFLINIKEWLHEHGYLTPKQMSALNNIIEKFEME